MNRFKLLLSTIIIIIIISCKASHKNSIASTNKEKKDSISSVNSKQEQDKFRFIVSFYSNGSGTDRKMKEKYLLFIKDFEQKRGVAILRQNVNWGEEGEIDYCFKLSELNTSAQLAFINESKNLLKESALVVIEENTISKHKK